MSLAPFTAKVILSRVDGPAARGNDGRAIPPTRTESTISATIQPVRNRMVILPEGYSSSDARRMFSRTELRTVDQYNETGADRITVGGETFQVQSVKPRPARTLSPLRHTESLLLKLRKR